MHAKAVHNPCLALVETPCIAPINVPNALVANDAIKHAPKPAHSRPPREIWQPKRMYSMATVRLRNEQIQLERKPASSCCSFGRGATERRMPSADRFAWANDTAFTAKLMAIIAAMPSNA